MFITFFLLLYSLTFLLLKKCEKLTFYKKLIAIISATAFIRIFVMIFIKVTPMSDYALYFKFAKTMVTKSIGHSNYVAWFPHIVGYPSVLSRIFAIFGSSVDVAVAFNIFCSVFTAGVLFYLSTLILASERKGYWAAAIWLLWPSQIFLVLLTATEPIFTMGLVLFIYLITLSIKKFELKILPSAICFALLGILCALLNALRPIGLIILVSSVVYLFFTFFNMKKKNSKTLISVLLSIILLFTLNSIIQKKISSEISSMIEQEVSSFPVGFNVFVGTNEATNGTNSGRIQKAKEIFALKPKNNLTAQETHNMFMKEAINNIKTQGLGNFKLLVVKNALMWMSDDRTIGTIKRAIIVEKSMNYGFNATLPFLFFFTNIYYLIFFAFMLKNILVCISRGEWKNLMNMSFLVSMFVLSVGLYCIVEIQNRYHYPLLPIFALFAAIDLRVYAPTRINVIDHFVSTGEKGNESEEDDQNQEMAG